MAQRSRARRIVRRVMFTVGGLFAAFLVLGIIGAIVDPQPRDTAATSTSTTALPPATTTTTAPPPPHVVVLAPPPPPVETVTRVVDGDTFVIGARTIRVLG